MLLNILQCQGSFHDKELLTKNANSAEVEMYSMIMDWLFIYLDLLFLQQCHIVFSVQLLYFCYIYSLSILVFLILWSFFNSLLDCVTKT